MKKRIKVLTSIGVTASLLLIGAHSKVHASAPIGTVQVKAKSLYLRAGNSFNSKVVRVLHKGEHYNVYAKKNGMYNLGQNSWVSASGSYVAYAAKGTFSTSKPVTVSGSSAGKVQVKASKLNVRQSANFSSRIVGTAYKGQTYTIYEKKNGLYRIGQNRWITTSATYVSSNGSVSASASTSSEKETSNADANSVIAYAKRFLGMRYIWASSNPVYGGFDCSGFIYYVFKNNGYNIGRTNVEGYWKMAQRVSSPKVGDLVFFQGTYRIGPSHIGIYLGNGQFLNANTSHGVSITSLSSTYWRNHFLGYGRLK